jgi:lipopolysaccharide exporter
VSRQERSAPERMVSEPPGLGRQVRSGVAWSGISAVAMRLASFAVGIVAARLLTPSAFGVFAVALTVHMIVLNMSDLGVSAYVVQTRVPLDRVAPTVMTIALVSCTGLAAAMALTAPPRQPLWARRRQQAPCGCSR